MQPYLRIKKYQIKLPWAYSNVRKIATCPSKLLLKGNKFVNRQAVSLQDTSYLKFHDEGKQGLSWVPYHVQTS